jgi:hypothetical protein
LIVVEESCESLELAEIFDGLDYAADLMIRIGEISHEDICLPDEELLLLPAERVPLRQFLRSGGQLGILGMMPRRFWLCEDRLAQIVPTAAEQMHVADLLDPLGCEMVRRVGGARHASCGWPHRPSLFPDSGHDCPGRGNGCDISTKVPLPLAGISSNNALEVLEALWSTVRSYSPSKCCRWFRSVSE